MKKIIIFITILIGIFGMSEYRAIAAESESIRVADVAIYEAKIISQTDNLVKISFKLINEKGTQPDIRYGVQLIRKEGEKNILVDARTYDETINLTEKEILQKEIDYIAPNFLKGQFEVWIESRTSQGLPLGFAKAGIIDLFGSGQYLKMVNDTCFFIVEGEANSPEYSALQKVDIAPEEKLIIKCQLANQFDKDIDFAPKFETYLKSAFGQKVEVEESAPVSQKIKAKESAQFSFILPKAKTPQIYYVKMVFESGGQTVSLPTFFQYILRGASATIENLRLDKDYYLEGETVLVSFVWTSGEDWLSGLRAKERTQLGEILAQISIKDGQGDDCVKESENKINESELLFNFRLAVIKDCKNPQVNISIKQSDGSFLGSHHVSINSKNVGRAKTNYQMFFYGAVILLALVIIFFMLRFMKRSGNITTLIFFLILFGLFFSFSQPAEAATYFCQRRGTLLPSGFYYSGNFIGKSAPNPSYNPGSTITFEGAMFDIMYGGDVWALLARMDATINNVTQIMPAVQIPLYYNLGPVWTANFTAPTVEGAYTAAATYGLQAVATGFMWAQCTDYFPYSVLGTSVGATLTVFKAGTGSGTVTGSKIDCGSICSASYTIGTNVTLTTTPAATPAPGSTFAGWSGGGCSGTGTCTVSMTEGRDVTATFNLIPVGTYTLTVSKAGTGSGTVTSAPGGISCGSDCNESYPAGTNVTLTATPATDGSTFAGWSGYCTNPTGTCTVPMNQTRNVTATFNNTVIAKYTCSSGSCIPDNTCSTGNCYTTSNCDNACPSGGSWYACSGYQCVSVPCTADPYTCSWSFYSSLSSCQASCNPPPPSYYAALDLHIKARNNNWVQTNGGGCSSRYNYYTGENYWDCTFLAGWENAIEGDAPWLIDFMLSGNSNLGIGATWNYSLWCDRNEANPYQPADWSASYWLTYETASNFRHIMPTAGICDAKYRNVGNYKLQASLTADSWGWSASAIAKSVINIVSPSFYDKSLAVSKSGDGFGTVNSSPSGIACGSDCLESYAYGTNVTLTASAIDSNSTFTGWSGQSSSATGYSDDQCAGGVAISSGDVSPAGNAFDDNSGTGWTSYQSRTISGYAYIGYDFGRGNKKTITKMTIRQANNSANSLGSVIVGYSDDNMSWTALQTFTIDDKGDKQDLIITNASSAHRYWRILANDNPNPGRSSWSVVEVEMMENLCSATNRICNLSMTQARSVTATFISNSYLLTVIKTGTGFGAINPSTGSLSWTNNTGIGTYASGASVTLTAVADSGSTFSGFGTTCADVGGAVSGNQCLNIPMTQARRVTATFTLVPTYILSVSSAGGTVTSNPTGINCGSTCSFSYISGTNVTLTATPNTGFIFNGWSGACSGTGSCVVSMTQAKSVTASFIAPDFSLFFIPPVDIYATLVKGVGGPSNTVAVTIVPLYGFSSPVTLSVISSVTPALPVGSTLTFDGASSKTLTSASYLTGSQFQVNIGPGLIGPQVYTIIVQGVGGGRTSQATILLNVQIKNPEWEEI